MCKIGITSIGFSSELKNCVCHLINLVAHKILHKHVPSISLPHLK